jgi:hypothetical protein
MSRREGTLYARMGLQLVHHHRAIEVGEAAMGVYSFCVMYSRLEELDGFVPVAAAERCWSGNVELNRERISQLCKAGLLIALPHGFSVVNFAEFNETKAEIHENRRKTKARVTRYRAVTTPPCNAFVPVSVSVSDLQSKEDPESQAPPPPQPEPITAVRASGAAGFAAESWIDGVRSVTSGRPTLAPWERRDIEAQALDRPPDADPVAWGHSEGAAFAKRQHACRPPPQVTARNYLAWVGDGRPGPFDRTLATMRQPDTPNAAPSAKATAAMLRKRDAVAPLSAAEAAQRASEALDRLGS